MRLLDLGKSTNMQKRIGILFSVILGCLWVLHIVSGISKNVSISVFLESDHIYYFVCFAIALFTVFISSEISKMLQIVIMTIVGVVTLYGDSRGLFTGLSIFFIDILLAYSYGVYSKRPVLRLICSIVVLYFAFLFSPQCNINSNKYLNAASWMLFLSGMCFAVWFIFKDQLERLQELERQNKERYMRIIEEATSVARDAIALCEEEKKKIQKER